MKDHEMPFSPSDLVLSDLLRIKYITKVSKWLLGFGKSDMAILAQASDSAWESALTVITLSEVYKILEEKNEEPELRKEISRKSVLVGDWLLSKKIINDNFVHWEGVTWDTSVIIQALLVIISEYKEQESLSNKKIEEIELVAIKGCKWLYHRFTKWDSDIKYPFGAADVAKLVLTFTKFFEYNDKLYEKLVKEYADEIDAKDDGCWLSKIIEHLLQGRIEETLIIDNNGEKEEVLTYWWDDYFTTAEVTEGLAVYYNFCADNSTSNNCDKKLLEEIKDSLIRSCTYFEQGQVDGMWGSHIDTIKVIYSYVLIRRLVHSKHYDIESALIEPEIHTVFKGLRWMCDGKQRFSDGSFMHTMFLTVFFAAALVEVYKSWKPAQDTIDKIYDDVVWAAPVRTTPERIKRLSAEIKNSNLEDKILMMDKKIQETKSNAENSKYHLISTILILLLVITLMPLIIYMGVSASKIVISTDTSQLELGDFLTYITTVMPIMGILITAIIKRKSISEIFN